MASNKNIFLQRHEDKCTLGIPDVSYCYQGRSGWIEAKYLPSYPKRKTTSIFIKHFTAEQQLWIKRYIKSGGTIWLFLRIEKDIYFIKMSNAY
jgi:hypothetical protein